MFNKLNNNKNYYILVDKNNTLQNKKIYLILYF